MAKQLKITSFFNSPASTGPKPTGAARPTRGTPEDDLEVSIIDDSRDDDTGNDADVDDDDIILIEQPSKSMEKVVRPMPVMTLLSDSSDDEEDEDKDKGTRKNVAGDQAKTAVDVVEPKSDDDTNIEPLVENYQRETKKRPLAEISSTNEADEDSGEDSDEVQKPRQRARTTTICRDQTRKSGNNTTRQEETPCKIEEDGIIGMKVRSPPNARVAPIQLD